MDVTAEHRRHATEHASQSRPDRPYSTRDIALFYLLLVHRRNPIAFVAVQSHWGRHTTWPWEGIVQALIDLFWNQPFGSFNEAHIILDLSATIGFIVLCIIGRHKLRISYSIWVAVLLFYILLSPGVEKTDVLVSNQRFVLEMFPAFITLAMLGIKHPRLHQAFMLLFPTLLATLSVLFIMNRWMV